MIYTISFILMLIWSTFIVLLPVPEYITFGERCAVYVTVIAPVWAIILFLTDIIESRLCHK